MTLARTLAQVRKSEEAFLGTLGSPNPWSPWGEDCLKFQLFNLGVAKRSDQSNPHVSIQAFLASTPWLRVKPHDLRAGDLALMQFDDKPDLDHIGFCYSIDLAAGRISTLEANTSPKVGLALTPQNRGVYKKTRDLGGEWLSGGIRPPYLAEAAVTGAKRRAEVREILRFLDEELPSSVARSTAGPTAKGPGDGVPGPVYWLEVQLWGRQEGLYPEGIYEADGIEGPRTEWLEDRLEEIVRKRAAGKKAA